jgi:hypothetical protein
MASDSTGFPPFPLLLEIPSGFPHFHHFDSGIDFQNSCKSTILVLDINTARGL